MFPVRNFEWQGPVIILIVITPEVGGMIRPTPGATPWSRCASLPRTEFIPTDIIPAAIASARDAVLGVTATTAAEALSSEFECENGVSHGEAFVFAFLGGVAAGFGSECFEGEGAVVVLVGVAAEVGGGADAGGLKAAGGGFGCFGFSFGGSFEVAKHGLGGGCGRCGREEDGECG